MMVGRMVDCVVELVRVGMLRRLRLVLSRRAVCLACLLSCAGSALSGGHRCAGSFGIQPSSA